MGAAGAGGLPALLFALLGGRSSPLWFCGDGAARFWLPAAAGEGFSADKTLLWSIKTALSPSRLTLFCGALKPLNASAV